MDRRQFVFTTIASAVVGRSTSSDFQDTADSVAKAEGTNKYHTQRSQTGPAIGGTDLASNAPIPSLDAVPTATQDEVVLSGQLTGNFSSEVGTVQIGLPGENISVNVLSNGSFSVDVPKNTPLDVAYVEYDSDDPVVFNGSPDVHYLTRIEELTNDRELGLIEIPESYILDLKFEDQDGNPLNNIITSVRSLDSETDRWWEVYTSTNTDGFFQSAGSPTGIEVSGAVKIAVLADSDDARIPDTDVVVDNIMITDAQFKTYTIDPVTASGQIVRPSGAPVSGGDLSIFIDRENAANGTTDNEGEFSIQIPRNEEFITGAYQIQYYRTGLGDTNEPIARGDWVDMYAGPQLTGTVDQNVGTIQLPKGDLVTVRTVDESGNSVEGAVIRFDHQNESEGTVAAFTVQTDRTGQISLSGQTGLKLTGAVELFASPPDKSRFVDTTLVRSITVDESKRIEFTLPTKSAEFQLEFVDAPVELVKAKPYTVSVTVTNQGGGSGTQAVSYTLEKNSGSETVIETSTTSFLEAEGSTKINFDISATETEPIETGNYVHMINSNDDQISKKSTVVVEASDEGSPLSGTAGEYDADNTGTITASELGDAVTDFGQGDLTASELGDVVTAFGQS